MQAFLNLNARAWRQIRRSWALPSTAALEMQTHVVGRMRSATAAFQSLIVRSRAPEHLKEGAVVILGFWRSGTTLLHELLCVDDRFGYPTTYACLNPHNFVLTQAAVLARYAGKVQRVQDKMMIGLRSPQEDEFALLCLGARSPYEGILAPRHFAEALALADPNDLPKEDARYWREVFQGFLRGVSLVGGDKPLVLKSPTHSYRVPALRDALPDARFILMVRNPYEVFESMVRACRALTQKYGLGLPLSDEELRSIVLSARKPFETKLNTGTSDLPASRFAVVRYENLVQQPLKAMENLYRQLDLPDFEFVRPQLEAEISGRRDYLQESAWPSRGCARRIAEEWRNVFDQYGYGIGDPDSGSPH